MLNNPENYAKIDGDDINVVEDCRYKHEQLQSFKKPFDINSDMNWNEYNGSMSDDGCDDGCSNGADDEYNTNIFYAIIQTAMAGLGSSLPNLKFIGIDEDGQKAARFMFQTISYWFLRDETQSKILSTIQDAFISGAGYTYIGFADDKREVNVTTWKNGKAKIKKEKIRNYYGPKTHWIPFKNVHHNGYNLEGATEVYIERVMSECEFDSTYNPEYNSLYNYDIEDVMTKSVTDDVDAEEVKYVRFDNVTIVEKFDLIKNTWVVIANDSWINKYEGGLAPNPYPHRQAPIAEFVPYPNAHHQYGDTIAQKTEQQRREYNEINKTIIQSADLMKGFLGGEAFEDDNLRPQIDEETGLRIMNGYTKESVWHYAPNINLSYHMQHKRDIINDIILVAGIDFTNLTVANPYETSTSVNSRKQSFDKRINLVIKQNYLPYFGRIAYQMISNLQGMYNDKEEKMHIPFVDKKVKRDDNGFISIENDIGNTGTLEVTSKELYGKIDFFVDGDMLVGPNKQAQFEEMEHMVGILTALKNPQTGQPFVNPEQVVNLMGRMYNYHNVEDVLGNPQETANEDIINQIFGSQGNQVPTAPVVDNTGTPTQGSRSNISDTL